MSAGTGTWEIRYRLSPTQLDLQETAERLVQDYATVTRTTLDADGDAVLYVVAREQRDLEEAVMWLAMEIMGPVQLVRSEIDTGARPPGAWRRWFRTTR